MNCLSLARVDLFLILFAQCQCVMRSSHLCLTPIEFQKFFFQFFARFFKLPLFFSMILLQFIEFGMQLQKQRKEEKKESLVKFRMIPGNVRWLRDMFKNLTSFSLSLSSASFSLTRRTNIWRISSSLLCNSAKWFERFASNVCWNETWKARAWQKIQIIV